MNVLYVTSNSYLRSTTSSLNAIISQLRPGGVEPIMLFNEKGPWQAHLEQQGVTCYFADLAMPDKWSPIRSLREVAPIIQIIRRHKIKLIHCNEHEHYPLMRLVARWTSCPIVVTLHWNLEANFGKWAFAPPYSPSALQFLSRAQLECSRNELPDGFDTQRIKLLMSGLAIDDFLSRGSDGSELRKNWVDRSDTVVVGTASAIKPRKRLEDFIQIIGRLRADGLPILGVIAGGGRFTDDGYHRSLLDLIEQKNLQKHCIFVGNLDPVTPFYRALDIAVSTSEMEILSMSLCEAMACQLPTFAYAVGGNPETLPDPWCRIPFGDVEEFASRVAALVRDPDGRRAFGGRAERYVREKFDAPILACRQAGIYNDVLATRSKAFLKSNRSHPGLGSH
jgi:glycosyltransferase involved in cell wall biosynthesis